MTVGLVSLLIGIERTSIWGLILGVVLVAAFVRHSHRHAESLIPWRCSATVLPLLPPSSDC